MLEIVGAVSVVAVVLIAVVMLAGRATSRSWSEEEFERRKRAGTAGGNAFLALQAMFNPGAQHALEQRTVEEAEDDDSGDPPDPGQREVS